MFYIYASIGDKEKLGTANTLETAIKFADAVNGEIRYKRYSIYYAPTHNKESIENRMTYAKTTMAFIDGGFTDTAKKRMKK